MNVAPLSALLTLLVTLSSLAFIACDSDDGVSTPAEIVQGDTIGGEVSADTTPAPADTVADAGPQCPPPTGARPTARAEHAGIYDPVNHRLVTFGGSFGVPVNCSAIVDHTFENELWFFDIDCGQWRLSTAPAPVGRVRHAAVYDSREHRVLVYGGREREPGTTTYSLHPEVLTFDLEAETWGEVPTTSGPDARYNAAVVYEPEGHRMLVFGGNTSSSGVIIAEQDDVWSLDLDSGTWTEIQTAGEKPPARTWVAGAWDATRNFFVVYGGSNNAQAFSPTAQYFEGIWALDFNNDPPSWLRLDSAVQKPDGRFWPGLIHDTVNDRMLVFGGHDDQGLGNRNDLWGLAPAAGTWEPIRIGDTFNNGPSGFCMFPPDFTVVDPQAPERRHAHVFVGGNGKAWTTGGKTDCGNVDDVWELDLESLSWTELLTATVGEACLRKGGLSCTDMCF